MHNSSVYTVPKTVKKCLFRFICLTACPFFFSFIFLCIYSVPVLNNIFRFKNIYELPLNWWMFLIIFKEGFLFKKSCLSFWFIKKWLWKFWIHFRLRPVFLWILLKYILLIKTPKIEILLCVILGSLLKTRGCTVNLSSTGAQNISDSLHLIYSNCRKCRSTFWIWKMFLIRYKYHFRFIVQFSQPKDH